jgi:NAD(P)-dependent dehydrogenase (short-subunit alcohol dehydrogenase family)
MQRLKGRVAVVTGGAGGIGAASAIRLAAEGARIVVADINEGGAREVATRIGKDAIACRFDGEDNESIRAMIELAVERFGRLDILYNNAALTDEAVASQDSNAVSIPFEIWDRTMAVNVRAYLAGCKFAIPHMVTGGSIINTASGAGTGGNVSQIAYGASKAAVMALTRFIATQHGKQGIRCNAVVPGPILTNPVMRLPREILEILSRHVLTPRLGQPEDIAAMVAFLASDESGFVTGQEFYCDGGLQAHLPHTAELQAYLDRA